MPHIKIEDLSCNRHVQNCRTMLRVLEETLTSYRLGKSKAWQQLFTDGTSRRQIAIQNLIVSVIEGEDLRPLVMSSAMILEGETSEQQHDAMLGILRKGGQRLQ